jgi:hypothetical protein
MAEGAGNQIPGAEDAQTPPPAITPVVQPPGRWQDFREITAAFLSAAIVLVALSMLVDTYSTGKQNFAGNPQPQGAVDAYNRQRDVLLFALGLLGTVTGYYLGRVPAEARANTAERAAGTAQQTANVATQAANAANQNTESVKRDTDAMLAHISDRLSAGGTRRGTLSGTDVRPTAPSPEQIQEVQAEIDAFRRRLR